VRIIRLDLPQIVQRRDPHEPAWRYGGALMKAEIVVRTTGQNVHYFAEEEADATASIDAAVFGAIDRLQERIGRDAPIRLVFDNSAEFLRAGKFVKERIAPNQFDPSRLMDYVREFFAVAEVFVAGAWSANALGVVLLPAADPHDHTLCPIRVQSSLQGYVRGLPTGDFLRAVLSNDLAEAIARADDVNLPALPHIVAYVQEQLPAISHGSKDAVDRWLRTKRDERMKSEPYGPSETQMQARIESVANENDVVGLMGALKDSLGQRKKGL
jgi:hypothetical protein